MPAAHLPLAGGAEVLPLLLPRERQLLPGLEDGVPQVLGGHLGGQALWGGPREPSGGPSGRIFEIETAVGRYGGLLPEPVFFRLRQQPRVAAGRFSKTHYRIFNFWGAALGVPLCPLLGPLWGSAGGSLWGPGALLGSLWAPFWAPPLLGLCWGPTGGALEAH